MAKYTFKCDKCEKSLQLYTPSTVEDLDCRFDECEGTMIRQLPTLNGPPNTTEIIDKRTSKTARTDMKELVQSRRDEYFWTVEVPRLVNSGTYGLQTLIENEWIWIDDNDKIHIHTKPPHLR